MGTSRIYEVTDIDRTFTVGLSQSGKPWGRPEDTFGLAGNVNTITKAHQAYFNAGGLGIVIGDGMLPHPGPADSGSLLPLQPREWISSIEIENLAVGQVQKDFQDNWNTSYMKNFQDNWNTSYMNGLKDF